MKGSHEPQEEEVFHGFYQWVGIALFGQSFTFYIPHFLWKSCEGKKVERLVSGEIRTVMVRSTGGIFQESSPQLLQRMSRINTRQQ